MDRVGGVPRQASFAAVAGLAYLATIACGLFAEAFVRSSIRAADAADTAARLQAMEPLYRAGILADAVMLISYVVVTALLYRLLKPVDATLSLLAALFSAVGIAVLASSLLLLMVPLLAAPAAAAEALRLHGAAYEVSGLFFGPYCLLLGWLAARSGWIPAWIGGLLALAGAAFLLDGSLGIAAPALARRVPGAVMLLSLIGEGALALFLTFFGLRGGRGRAS